MEDVIYLIQPDGNLVEMTAQPYESEPILQELLAKYPHLLAGGQMNEDNPRRWLLIAREMGIAWEEGGGDQLSLDHLFLDQEGIPTLVEVKRSSDTRIRREVVGQMLEYAANAVIYWPVEKIRARFDSRCAREMRDPAQELAAFLGYMDGNEGDPSQFWQQVHTNLQAGRVRMVFVADEVPFQLRRIVEFLNEQMREAEVLAVEVKQYVGGGLQTLVPRVIGQTTQAQGGKSNGSSDRKKWNRQLIIDELATTNGDEAAQAAKSIFEWADTHMPEWSFGQGKRSGSAIPRRRHNGKLHELFVIWTSGDVEFRFDYIAGNGSLDESQRKNLIHNLNHKLGVAIPAGAFARRSSIPITLLVDVGKRQTFLEVVEWALQEIGIEISTSAAKESQIM